MLAFWVVTCNSLPHFGAPRQSLLCRVTCSMCGSCGWFEAISLVHSQCRVRRSRLEIFVRALGFCSVRCSALFQLEHHARFLFVAQLYQLGFLDWFDASPWSMSEHDACYLSHAFFPGVCFLFGLMLYPCPLWRIVPFTSDMRALVAVDLRLGLIQHICPYRSATPFI